MSVVENDEGKEYGSKRISKLDFTFLHFYGHQASLAKKGIQFSTTLGKPYLMVEAVFEKLSEKPSHVR